MKKLLLLFILIPFTSFCQVQIGSDIDGEATDDESGVSVSLSSDGNIVAIGANYNSGNGTISGHVRIYENQSGVWTQIGSDIDGETAGDQSGFSVSLSSDGSIVAIGAARNAGNGSNSGHVRIYENQSGVWTQIGSDIDGEAVDDESGWSLSLSSDGNIVAIGAVKNDGNGNRSGHVRIYENQSGVWTQIGSDIDGEAELNWLGYSVNLSADGSVVATGAIFNSENGTNSGHVRIYENQSGVWTQIGSDIDSEAAGDFFGRSLSLSSNGSIIAIGASQNDGNGSNSGHVRIYENQSGVWTQLGSDIDGEAEVDSSGYSVSLSSDGGIVAIGAPFNAGNGNNSGHVRIYRNQFGVWTQLGLDIDGESVDDLSGGSVSLSSDGSILAVGAQGNSENGSLSGHVRVFSIASNLALLEVVEDILGNSNGINITANQLNSITGVSGAIEGVNYTTALDNGTFVDENNPTALEIQAIIDQVNATLSVTTINTLEFQLYPNPTKNQFTIQLENSTELQNVNIYNNLGQLVLTSKESVVNTTVLSSGIYVVEIQTNKGKGSKKLIIE